MGFGHCCDRKCRRWASEFAVAFSRAEPRTRVRDPAVALHDRRWCVKVLSAIGSRGLSHLGIASGSRSPLGRAALKPCGRRYSLDRELLRSVMQGRGPARRIEQTVARSCRVLAGQRHSGITRFARKVGLLAPQCSVRIGAATPAWPRCCSDMGIAVGLNRTDVAVETIDVALPGRRCGPAQRLIGGGRRQQRTIDSVPATHLASALVGSPVKSLKPSIRRRTLTGRSHESLTDATET